MSEFITQTLLPISLAVMMLAIGISVKGDDFTALNQQKKAIIGGWILQSIALPLLALLLITTLGIRGEYAVAIMIVACCPGGVTSNALTFIFSGVVALSVVLTLLSSVVAPVVIPWVTEWALGHFIGDTAEHQFALGVAVIKLFVLSIIPLVLGAGIRRVIPTWCARHSQRFRQIAGWWFLALIVAMVASNYTLLSSIIGQVGGFIICMAIAAIALGVLGARLLGFGSAFQLTLGIEVGVQNAGMGLVVTGAILHNQTMTMTLIAYGILMQIPVLLFAYFYRRFIVKSA